MEMGTELSRVRWMTFWGKYLVSMLKIKNRNYLYLWLSEDPSKSHFYMEFRQIDHFLLKFYLNYYNGNSISL